MRSLIEVAAWALAESGAARSARIAAIRMAVAALCAGLAAVLMLAVLGAAAAALWIFTLPSLGPVGAPLVVAATLSTVTLIVAAAAWLTIRQGRRRSDSAIAPQLLLSEAMRLLNEHKGAVLLAAVVAAMAAANTGRKP
jgi:hypothetical protein